MSRLRIGSSRRRNCRGFRGPKPRLPMRTVAERLLLGMSTATKLSALLTADPLRPPKTIGKEGRILREKRTFWHSEAAIGGVGYPDSWLLIPDSWRWPPGQLLTRVARRLARRKRLVQPILQPEKAASWPCGVGAGGDGQEAPSIFCLTRLGGGHSTENGLHCAATHTQG
jgi:hypothetical protein